MLRARQANDGSLVHGVCVPRAAGDPELIVRAFSKKLMHFAQKNSRTSRRGLRYSSGKLNLPNRKGVELDYGDSASEGKSRLMNAALGRMCLDRRVPRSSNFYAQVPRLYVLLRRRSSPPARAR